MFFKAKKSMNQQPKRLNTDLEVTLDIPDQMTKKQVQLVKLTKTDLSIAKSLQPLIDQHLDTIVNGFYEQILSIPKLNDMIHQYSTTERLKLTLSTHIQQMFSGCIDNDFFSVRKQVAQVHYQIGLRPKWYMGAFQNLLTSLMSVLRTEIEDPDEYDRAFQAISKLLNFEQQLVLEEYENEEKLQRERVYEQVKNDLKEKITVLSEELATLSQQTSLSVEHLIETTDHVNQTIQHGAMQSKKTSTHARDGKSRMGELSNNMDDLSEKSQNMQGFVNQLATSSNEIKRVIGLVKSIAEQTNLLALNSAIEAARAGEYGKGFAVVADEVRKLSDETKDSVEVIEQLVQSSIEDNEKVTMATQEVDELIVRGTEEAKQTEESFQNIASATDENIELITSVDDQFKHIVETVKEIRKASEEVASSAKQLNDNTKEV
ncbi:globin-coupled sensor protein [Texcoconibacillus texcoconensis]|uniref:Heme-based aerotactic transducer n=1 Tax=Texcoconibacillus texcoconensis TaxID=1095777 RepID=A0A840QPL9_9BACI|nr:globin-coupled sensor protein [Texcoconibacillus texcoconensis]MBB5173267.1 heme-based aerotactic transducer [Texcoconibacillus texcoconensis]